MFFWLSNELVSWMVRLVKGVKLEFVVGGGEGFKYRRLDAMTRKCLANDLTSENLYH